MKILYYSIQITSSHFKVLYDHSVLKHSKIIKRLDNTLGSILATLGLLTEFRFTFNGNRGSVTLMFGDTRRKRTIGKTPCAPGAVNGGTKTGSSTARGGSVFRAAPSSREVQVGGGGTKAGG